MSKDLEQVKDTFSALREGLGIPETWSSEDSLKRIKAGSGSVVEGLLAAHSHLGKKGFFKYCAELGKTTKQAKEMLLAHYGMMGTLFTKPKPKSEPIRNKPSVKMKFAADWLCKFLLDKGEFAVPAWTCLTEARKQGIKPRTLQRAKHYLSIYCFRRNRQWYWYLER